MKTARVAVIGVAVVAGLTAALLARQLLNRPAPVAAVAAGPVIASADVLVASRDLPMGSALDAAAFKWQSWPKDGLSASYITRDAKPGADTELTGSIARSSFVAGEPINEAKLIRSDRGFMSAILPAGQRAVATAISADTSAGGFILPNDRVDVIMTRKLDNTGGSQDRFSTETVLSNVRVLAIDQTLGEKDGEKVVVGQTATLELSAEQAQILTVAQQMSQKLTLALRSLADATASADPDAVHLIQNGGERGGVRIVRNGVTQQVETR
ncbi:pilus assembly protein CpaB [Kaistia soli DSM 19436]|uniref:Pilus assembly protein CpaB n=1 Tax=Kaistia soli DSM 19436 TaxID=1122133 RepID=A0A1M5P1X2_9HYPH|nr:Flp pilus assembly protein CpaB [Kaistia soli]SHG95816.1 pilus assembly protein CpaB [Kaistia soli DSM 19436]